MTGVDWGFVQQRHTTWSTRENVDEVVDWEFLLKLAEQRKQTGRNEGTKVTLRKGAHPAI